MSRMNSVEDYLHTLIAELLASHSILADTCGPHYLEFVEAWIEIAKVLARLCPSMRMPQHSLLCFDVFDSINAAILSTMRGNIAVSSIAARRMLEEVSSWFTGVRRPYDDQALPKVYTQLLSGTLSEEDVEVLADSMKKLIKGVYSFLCAFSHPEGEGILPYMGIWLKPPMIDTDPELCRNAARPLAAITMAMLLVATPIIAIYGDDSARNRLSEVLARLHNMSVDEPRESIELLKALTEVALRAIAGHAKKRSPQR